jgi:hypothetical protein
VKGIEHYTSSSGFHCIRCHYSADPSKDPDTEAGRAWMENELKGIPGGIGSHQWRVEYEIDWDAAGGELVFPYFEAFRSRIVRPPFKIPETWNLYASFDYGHRNPSSFHVYALDHDNNIWVIWEYYSSGKGFRQIARSIRSCEYFGKLCYLPIADPSIWAKTQQTESGSEMKSIAQLFYELPPEEQIVFSPGKKGGDITVAEKINGDVWNEEKLKEGKQPGLFILATCPFMIWELGKLRYKDWSGSMQEQRNLQESIVDKDNHAWDDLKMLMTMFFMAPGKPEDDKLEVLKRLDPASYEEWKSVARLHGEETGAAGSMGDFENEESQDE